jgi:hypothetical protein
LPPPSTATPRPTTRAAPTTKNSAMSPYHGLRPVPHPQV